jgi:hypothetical protein
MYHIERMYKSRWYSLNCNNSSSSIQSVILIHTLDSSPYYDTMCVCVTSILFIEMSYLLFFSLLFKLV